MQGRGEAGDELIDDALALEEAGAFAVVLEMVPADVAEARHRASSRSRPSASAPAPHCDGQVLVWQDMAGLRTGRCRGSSSSTPTCARVLTRRGQAFADDVVDRDLSRPRSTPTADAAADVELPASSSRASTSDGPYHVR